MTRREIRSNNNTNILRELTAIIRGVDRSIMNKFREELNIGEYIYVIDDENDTEFQTNKKNKPDFFMQTESLKYANKQLQQLSAKSNGASKYVKNAVDHYSRVISNLIDIPERLILDNKEIFYNLGHLSDSCVDFSEAYMVNDRPNQCLDIIILSKDPIGEMKTELSVQKQLGNTYAADSIQYTLNATESYLTMCDSCPFRASYKNRKDSKK